jgi:hypothetical protein
MSLNGRAVDIPIKKSYTKAPFGSSWIISIRSLKEVIDLYTLLHLPSFLIQRPALLITQWIVGTRLTRSLQPARAQHIRELEPTVQNGDRSSSSSN